MKGNRKMRKNVREYDMLMFMEELAKDNVDEYWNQKIKKVIKPVYQGRKFLLEYSKMSWKSF